MIRLVLGCVMMVAFTYANAQQQTVGIFRNDSTSFDGYTLFAPSAFENTYLIDNCGFIINEWESNYRPGQSAYLLDDGSLIRTARISSPFSGGGTGGRIERYNWEGELVWGYNYSTDEHHQHHDIEVLPNGNILILAWELHTPAEAIQAGRDPSRLSGRGLWSEQIVEIKPIGMMGGDIVWEWHLWDHLVQDLDSFSNNYGKVDENPRRIDINFPYNSASFDWIHANAIDYNPELDQIMINSRDFEEFWIIDHGTTTEEAAGNSGGRYGKGGDILYRWGNPMAYKKGTFEDKVFSLQHDAHWIPTGMPGEGQVMVFNNGIIRPEDSYSSVDAVQPDMQPDGSYELRADGTFGPDSLSWTYDGGDTSSFFSPRLAGSQRQPNGNTLICVGTSGRFIEIDPSGNIVWEYQSPVGADGPIPQGQFPPARDVFRTYRYAPDYPAFEGRDLTPGDPVELDPWELDCMVAGDTMTSAVYPINGTIADLRLFPNPVGHELSIFTGLSYQLSFTLFDSYGRAIQTGDVMNGRPISFAALSPGIYFLRIFDPVNQVLDTRKVIKQ